MNEKEFNDFIHFSDQKDYIENKLYKEEWVTVYQNKRTEENGYRNIISLYPCLISVERKKTDYRKDSSWIITMDFGRPGVVEYSIPLNFIEKVKQKLFGKLVYSFRISSYLWTPEQLKKRDSTTFKIKNFFFNQLNFLFNYKTKKIKQYQRFSEEGIEPLIHLRDFDNDKYPSYIEISEEFRHYFNLYEDKKNNIFLSSDDSGNPIQVIKINDDNKKREVLIKKKYLNEFLFVKKMWLCVQFQYGRFFKKELDHPINKEFQSKDKNFIYCIKSGSSHEKSFTRFRGRKFIKYKDVNFLWYEKERKYEEFSFINKNGEEQSFTCEEDKLANFYGKNEDSPNYLTPISFRKDVLKKYYDKPKQYSVSDGWLKCVGFWNMEIDAQDNRVVVFLGDLSKLPYEEQKYWRSYNTTEKATISRVNWERSFECKPTETDRPDFFFKNKYQKFNKVWQEKYGWSFFKPLSEKDKPCFDSLRIPLNEEQLEFDTQIQYLTKIFVDSINIKEIKKTFPTSYKEDSKTIDILDQCLKVQNIRIDPMIEFLRKLQKLRSKGPAHIETDEKYTKVLNYFKQLTGTKKTNSRSEIFSEILIRCIWIMNLLEKIFLNSKENK